ncbi:MAG: hypothetical protein V7K35_10100 [Nostoc sp.]|uniref:hypothetical protein n=1 Tax=Nostoc sp. TaxID=1180 RepID=UPI002FF86A34
MILADESFILADESFILADESFILADESFILADESFILADESFILADESFILVNESFILADESFILVNESFILADESFILVNESLNSVDEPQSFVDYIAVLAWVQYSFDLSPNLSSKRLWCIHKSDLPPLIPPYKGGKQEICFPPLYKERNKKSASLPFIRGGLGWGKRYVGQRVELKLTPMSNAMPLPRGLFT